MYCHPKSLSCFCNFRTSELKITYLVGVRRCAFVSASVVVWFLSSSQAGARHSTNAALPGRFVWKRTWYKSLQRPILRIGVMNSLVTSESCGHPWAWPTSNHASKENFMATTNQRSGLPLFPWASMLQLGCLQCHHLHCA